MNSDMQWMHDPELSCIPAYKLVFLQQMFFESKNLTEKERMPFLLSLASKSKSQNISFSDEEINLIIQVLKKYATEEDITKIDRFIHMAKTKTKK